MLLGSRTDCAEQEWRVHLAELSFLRHDFHSCTRSGHSRSLLRRLPAPTFSDCSYFEGQKLLVRMHSVQEKLAHCRHRPRMVGRFCLRWTRSAGRRFLLSVVFGLFCILLAIRSSPLLKHDVTKHECNAIQQPSRGDVVLRLCLVSRINLDSERTWEAVSGIDAAFLDPDWAVTGPHHVHRFRQSSTRPPADELLDRVFRATRNIALVLPPTLDIHELDGLPRNERQKLYMDGNHELYCLYFGDLANCFGQTEFRV